MLKNVTFDFYRASLPDDAPFATVLSQLGRTAKGAPRNLKLPSGVYQLRHVAKSGNQYEGEVIRIRMDDLPVKASLSGNIDPLKLNDDEGIGEQTAFLFDPVKSVLVLQRNRVGVSATMFVTYFHGKGGDGLYLEPIVTRDALKRMAELTEISKLEFTIAAPGDTSFLRSQGKGISEVHDLVDYFHAPAISITISKGHSKSYPMRNRIEAVARKLLNLPVKAGTGNVTKLRVGGPGENDESEMINLLLDQVQERKDIKYDDRTRSIPYAKRRDALQEALRKWYSQL